MFAEKKKPLEGEFGEIFTCSFVHVTTEKSLLWFDSGGE